MSLCRKALIMEEDVTLGRLLYRALNMDGFEIHMASDAGTVKDLLQEGEYDLLICELAMTDDDGGMFYHYLEKYYPDILPRTIFTCIPCSPENLQDFVQNHIGHFLTKPFTLQELKNLIADIQETREMVSIRSKKS